MLATTPVKIRLMQRKTYESTFNKTEHRQDGTFFIC